MEQSQELEAQAAETKEPRVLARLKVLEGGLAPRLSESRVKQIHEQSQELAGSGGCFAKKKKNHSGQQCHTDNKCNQAMSIIKHEPRTFKRFSFFVGQEKFCGDRIFLRGRHLI